MPVLRVMLDHWPEYAIEASLLGMFMVSACCFAVLLGHPESPVVRRIGSPMVRRTFMGLAMGVTAIALIYSPLGRRSGAHMNPATTLTFWWLGKVSGVDAVAYCVAHAAGGLAGIGAAGVMLGRLVRHESVNHVATVPGRQGAKWAWGMEVLISYSLMSGVLWFSNDERLAPLTGVLAGALVAMFIVVAAPVSGMSMNPARSLASAVPGRAMRWLWIYFTAPPLGMLLAAVVFVAGHGSGSVRCAKLCHRGHERCIFHCGYSRVTPSPGPHPKLYTAQCRAVEEIHMRQQSVGMALVLAMAGVIGVSVATAASPHDPELVCLREDHGFKLKDIPTAFVAIHFLGAPGSEEATKALEAYRGRLWEVAGMYHVFVCRGERMAEHEEWAKGIPADRLMIAMDSDAKLAAELNVSPGQSGTVVLDRSGAELVRVVREGPDGWTAFDEFAKAVGETTRVESVKEYNLPKGSTLAVEGYDVVSYIADGVAAKGEKELASWYRGVQYRFATSEHREAFARKPEKYLPTYGGWCASAMGAKGTKVEIDPKNFKVKDGRLFLFYKSAFGDALKDWNKHEAEWEPKADENWERVSGEPKGA